MKIVYLLHAEFERPGFVESWAAERGFEQRFVSTFKGEKLPTSCDMLVVMGGPQSAVKLDEAPYLRGEVDLIERAVGARVPVLGFCLGAQLIGEAFGARAERSTFKEIGVFPIKLTEEGVKDPVLAGCSREFGVFHWHNDMPGLSEGAVVLAESAGCPRQIVRYSSLAYGFQCHPEMTLEGAKGLVENCGDDLVEGKYIQRAQEILAHDYEGEVMMNILENFLRVVIPQDVVPVSE